MARTFLSAEWRKLLMANYLVDPQLLRPHLPWKTELDLWNGNCYVSLVGFMFLNTRVMGMRIPFHVNFEEVNLRFYVRYNDAGTWKRGVVFMKEIVPRAALSFVANTVYGEHYQTLPLKHHWQNSDTRLEVEYQWKAEGNWNTLSTIADNKSIPIGAGSEEEFITEHYWGYTCLGETKTSEYQVQHPRWEVYPVNKYEIDVDFGKVYGNEFGFLSQEIPKSVFLAEGSDIRVMAGKRIKS